MAQARKWQSIEEFEMFKDIELLCDEIWDAVAEWNLFAKDTVGKQLVRAVDSIGANLAEGDGRYHYKEKLNFYYIARASVKEACYWIRRARSRHVLSAEQANNFLKRFESVRRWINSLISQRRQWIAEVHEEPAEYNVDQEPIDP